MKHDNEQIEHLLPLYYEGKLDEEKEERVKDWLALSDEHRAIGESIAEAYRAMDCLCVLQHIDTSKALARVNGRLRRQRFLLWLRRLERVAAILFIPLAVVAFLLFYRGSDHRHVTMLSYATKPGVTATLTLPDSTEVVLNSDSRISYPERFTGDERRVELEGEAYFAVAKDGEHPFVVGTSARADIKVYGTRFNVEADRTGHWVRATLEEGAIAMEYVDGDRQWTERHIVPGEEINYRAAQHEVSVRKVEVDVVTSWKDGRLLFRNTPVKEVLKTLAKRYNVEFEVVDERVYKNSFTGVLEKQRLENVLEILKISSDMNFKPATQGNGYCEKYIVY